MRSYLFIICWFGGCFCVFGQASPNPVLYHLKENFIEVPAEFLQDKRWNTEIANYFNVKQTKNGVMVTPMHLGDVPFVLRIGGQEIWRKTFYIRRSTNVLYTKWDNEIYAEANLPTNARLEFETDNGSVRPRDTFRAFVYPKDTGRCHVVAKYQGKIVWQSDFEVRAAPPLHFQLSNTAGKLVDVSKPLPANIEIRIKAVRDSVFDSSVYVYYRIPATYTLYRGGNVIKAGSSFDGVIPAPQTLGARSGDMMSITTDEAVCTTTSCPTHLTFSTAVHFVYIVK